MTMIKTELTNYLTKIREYTHQKEQFINAVRNAINVQTFNQEERKRRLEIFDSLLLMATYADSARLEEEFLSNLPSPNGTITYICAQLREINGFCNQTFSDEHEGYLNIYNTLTYLTPEVKQTIRDKLSEELTTMILAKTDTLEQQSSELTSPKSKLH